MKRFRKKQIVIEAVQITDGTFDAPYPNLDHISGVVYDPIVRCTYIQAREGIMQADLGDWIIKGVRGSYTHANLTFLMRPTSQSFRLLRR